MLGFASHYSFWHRSALPRITHFGIARLCLALLILPFFMDEYKRKVDTELNSIINNYYQATSSLSTFKEDTPKNNSDLLYDTLQIKRAASNIVHSVESLLELTAQLKQSVILNDVKATNQHLLSKKSLLQKQNDSTLEIFKSCFKDCKVVYKQVEDALNF